MRRKFDWRYLLGAALVAAVVAAILAVFALMNRPGARELYLADGFGESFGWRYELLIDGEVRDYEPVYDEDTGFPALPEDTRAVRITRTMVEDIPMAELEWHSYRDGVEIFLDGELLHSDFHGEIERGENGFLHLTDEDWERLHRAQGQVWQRTRASLPADYLGKELSVVAYFPEDWGTPIAEYPYLGNQDSYIALFVLDAVKYDVMMTVYALLALLTAVMCFLDLPNEGADRKTALLSLFFLLLFVREAATSYAGLYSELAPRVDMNLLDEFYVVPLYLYMALRLKRKWRVPLCAAILAWAVYEVVRWCVRLRRGLGGSANIVGPWALLILLAVALASCLDFIAGAKRARWSRERVAFYLLIAAGVTAVNLFNRIHAWRSVRRYLLDGIWSALCVGNFEPVLSLLTDIVSALVLIAVVSEFTRRKLQSRQEVSVLQERARQTMEGYERLLAAESATSALHHEMRHHMIALSGILKSGDVERAARYAESVAGDLDRLPTGRYSQNLLVDVIAGSYLNRAWMQGIRVEHHLDVPPELDIADEDISVFLSNMLQNALEGCERLGEGCERHIGVEMRLRGKFLFIHCVNSAAEGEEPSRPGHGYGLTAMRKIAEKYNSALVIERADGEFSVLSDLCLNKS